MWRVERKPEGDIVSGKKELESETRMDVARLDQVSELKYSWFNLDESATYVPYCRRKMANGRKVAGAIRSVVNAA